jgi:hypothetical protein
MALCIDVAINIADTSCSLIPLISIPEHNLVEMQGQNREFRDLPTLSKSA